MVSGHGYVTLLLLMFLEGGEPKMMKNQSRQKTKCLLYTPEYLFDKHGAV